MACVVCLEDHPGYVMCRPSALAAAKSGRVTKPVPATIPPSSRIRELEALLAGIEAEKQRVRALTKERVRKYRENLKKGRS